MIDPCPLGCCKNQSSFLVSIISVSVFLKLRNFKMYGLQPAEFGKVAGKFGKLLWLRNTDLYEKIRRGNIRVGGAILSVC